MITLIQEYHIVESYIISFASKLDILYLTQLCEQNDTRNLSWTSINFNVQHHHHQDL